MALENDEQSRRFEDRLDRSVDKLERALERIEAKLDGKHADLEHRTRSLEDTRNRLKGQLAAYAASATVAGALIGYVLHWFFPGLRGG